MIAGANHLTIAVKDLQKSFAFYKDIMGFKPLMRWERGAYFLAGDFWFCLDLDPAARKAELPEYTHFAFSTDEKGFAAIQDRFRAAGVKEWKKNVSEGPSIYFLDPDGHKFEVHMGDWRSRLAEIRRKPWHPSIEVFEG